jgi:O-acetyl-ADP-ribose deacetylase (regulator of RNase III)
MEHLATWNGCAICLHQGDITLLGVDAIVNAANNQLWAGGGVCGAIHRRAGKRLAEECAAFVAKHGEVPTGEAAMTGGGKLPAKHVVHAVGPVYDEAPKKAPKLLASAYKSSLALARSHGLTSIAFPCISTGIYGYPPEEACQVAIRAVRQDLEEHDKLAKVVFCTFLASDYQLYLDALKPAKK